MALQNLIRTHIVLGNEKYVPEVFLRFSYFTTTYNICIYAYILLSNTYGYDKQRLRNYYLMYKRVYAWNKKRPLKEIIKYICVNILVESETHKLINEFLNDPWNHNSLQSWTTMLKTFFAIFSLAVFLLIQTTESHHMFRWELSQMLSFQNCFFFFNIFVNTTLGPITSFFHF